MSVLPIDLLQSLFSSAQKDVLEAVADQADEVLSDYDITASRTRMAYFLAQLAHESGGFRIFAENLSYSAKRLTEVWPSRFPTLASAQPYAKNAKALANKVYAKRLGNGNEASGDGYRYRGRGYIQITGKSNYETIGKITGLDLVGDPDQAADSEFMLLVACGFWKHRNLNSFADSGDFVGLTKAINGGTIGIDDRRAWLKKVTQKLAAADVGPEDVDVDGGKPPAVPNMPNDLPFPPAEHVLKIGSRGEQVKALQLALKNIGYQPGAIDGVYGSLTAREVLSFQLQNDLETTGVVDSAFWMALASPKPPALDNGRVTATADTLKTLGSRTVIDGDRTKWLGWITTALGALGIGNSAIVNMANSGSTPAAALQVSPDSLALLKDVVKLLPPNAIAGNELLKKFIENVTALPASGAGAKPGLQTIFDVLPGFFEKGVLNTGAGGLAQIAASILPGFGGSALTVAVGLAASFFGKRIVQSRTEDHRSGANTGK